MEVKIVIPIYKPVLSELEAISLNQACSVLSDYPFVFVKPQSLDLTAIQKQYPRIETESFDDKYFKNIIGYNHLLLQTDFYSRFLSFDYILIYQLDAYVFSNELQEWCSKGYDYIGGPWLQKPIYQYAFFRQWKRTKMWLKEVRQRLEKGKEAFEQQKKYVEMVQETLSSRDLKEVGNGGLSLRNVKSHYNATLDLKDRIDFYVSREERSATFNEDIFWSSEPKNFRYPSAEEALKFSFDKYPDLCYKHNGYQLPFGCHGWYKKKTIKFWKKIIDF